MNKHEQLIREIAEEMAKSMHPNKAQAGFTYEQLSQHYEPAARIAVKHMAEEFDNGFDCCFGSDLIRDAQPNEAERLKHTRGLIPAKEGGQDETL